MADTNITKEQLLEQLSYKDKDTLDKLLFYADNILIPEEDLLVNATMKQMMDKAFSLADTYFPDWTDRGVSDFGRFLIELFALFSEKDFYYINGYANENLLSKMSVYSDAFMRSVELGYYPTLCRSSEATFNIGFAPSLASYIIPRGSLVVNVLGSPYSFINLDDLTIESNNLETTLPVRLNEGKLITETFQFNSFCVYVSKSNIDTESLTVHISDLPWTRVRTFGQSNANSKHYVAIPEENGSIRIYFGDSSYGKRPEPNEAVTIGYLRCAASEANGLFGPATLNSAPTEVDVTTVEMLEGSSMGLVPDTLSDLKNKARNYFFNNYTLNNVPVVQSWLASQYEVKKNFVKIINNQVYFRIVPAISTESETTILDKLVERMQPLVTGGYFAQALLTEYVAVLNISVQIYFLKGFGTTINIAKVRNLISDYTNPYTLANYGRSFLKSELEVLLKSKITGLQNVIFTDINGSLLDIVVTPEKILSKVPDSGIIIDAYEN
jgi:hypothetical protein